MRFKRTLCGMALAGMLALPLAAANADQGTDLYSILSTFQRIIENMRGQLAALRGSNTAQVAASTASSTTTYPMPTGVHWAEPSEYSMLKQSGIDFVLTTSMPTDTARLKLILDTAESTGMKVIVGAYPEPYTLSNGQWTISADGVNFLKYLQSRPASIMALFVFNEPYWINPTTHQTSSCGAVSAAELRALRTQIKAIWPEAKIYHDIGAPGWWAPGGDGWKSYPCMADRYKDATNIADYVGIWDYPFKADGTYTKAASLDHLRVETSYVMASMTPALPVILGQSSSAPATDNLGFPTKAQIEDWNCALRTVPGTALTWYVWKQDLYPDYLQKHPDYLPSVVAGACGGTSTTTPPVPSNAAPQLGSVTPGSGSGLSQTFAFTFTDANGAADISNAHAIFGTSATGANNCMAYFDVKNNTVSLNTNDMSGAWPTGAPGSTSVLSNSQCKIYPSGTDYAKSGNVLTVTVPVEFAASFAGAKNIYMRAADNGGLVADYAPRGAWTVPSQTAPPPVAKFNIGDRVWTTENNVNVRSAPSLSASVLGKQKYGTSGYVVSGPQSANGYTWWQIDFSKGPDGWVAENYLTK